MRSGQDPHLNRFRSAAPRPFTQLIAPLALGVQQTLYEPVDPLLGLLRLHGAFLAAQALLDRFDDRVVSLDFLGRVPCGGLDIQAVVAREPVGLGAAGGIARGAGGEDLAADRVARAGGLELLRLELANA